jgi:hypothetical protein
VNEHEFEPVRGLPELLPPGEQLLWQGTPRWQSLAIGAFHARKVGLYFLALIAVDAVASLATGRPAGAVAISAAGLVVLALAAVGLLALLAWLTARSTVYSITTRRLVMRFGVALPMSINLPFSVIESASMRTRGDGSSDLPLVLMPGSRIGYLITWPHVRPWQFARPQPMLRAIADGERVAELLAAGLAASAGTAPAVVAPERADLVPPRSSQLTAAA